MERKVIRYAVRDNIATLTLNRPHRRNAWTGRMHVEYRWSLEQAEQDPAVRAIIVTGAGNDFCVGADSRALEGHVEKGGYDPGTPEEMANPGYGVRPEFDADFAYQFGLSKPVIAAVNGAVAGAGLAVDVTRTSGSRLRAPSSRPRTARSTCRPSSACPGCCRASWASPGRTTSY